MAAKKAVTKGAVNLLDQMAAAAADETVQSNVALTEVANLATRQMEQIARVERIEQQLKDEKAVLRQMETVDLPEAMKACGLKTFTTVDDLVIEVKADVQCGIPAPRRQEAYEWLVKNGFEGLLKSSIELTFDRDHLKDAQKIAAELTKKGFTPEFIQSVHAQTLKAFVKERMADTESKVKLPLDLFGVFPYDVAVVKKAKASKSKK